MITDINSEDRLVQETFANYLHDVLGWESIYAFNDETFGPNGTLGRASEREVVLVRDLRDALKRLNPTMPKSAREQAIEKLTRVDFARSVLQHNREFHDFTWDCDFKQSDFRIASATQPAAARGTRPIGAKRSCSYCSLFGSRAMRE